MSQSSAAPDAHPDATPDENARFVAFRAFLEAEGLSPITCACYASDWWNVAERIRAATKQPFQLDRLTADAFKSYRAEAMARGVSAATLNRRLAFLRRYARFAAATSPICGALADALADVAFEPVKPAGGRSALSPDEEERLMNASREVGATEHALVALLMRTGLRVDEALALLRGDVAGPPSAPTSLRVRGKRGKTVLLPPLTSRAVAGALAAQPGGDADPLLRARGRYALTNAGAAAIVARCAREARVHASPRTLRHTFAVRYLAEHRDDVHGLSSALGGASPALMRAWRDEASSSSAAPRLASWTTSSADGDVRTMHGAHIDAAWRRLRPGVRTSLPARPAEQLLLVVSGRAEIRVGRTRLEAAAGEAVLVPKGAAPTASAIGGKAAVLFAASAQRRRPH